MNQMHADSAGTGETRAREFLRRTDETMIGSKIVEQRACTLTNVSGVIELARGSGYAWALWIRDLVLPHSTIHLEPFFEKSGGGGPYGPCRQGEVKACSLTTLSPQGQQAASATNR